MLLQGHKVIELGAYIAAPVAACMMARWGAEVIKVEGLGGDAIRWVRPTYRKDIPPNFEIDNHSKRSLALDFSKPEGRDLILDLVRDADVFITSFRGASLARAGLDFDSLHALNPRLVYGAVSGYGSEGPSAQTNAFDLTAFWSRSGLALQVFPPDGLPAGVRPGVGDHITGMSLALGVMAALVERGRTGRGRMVETSLLATGVYVGSYDIVEHLRGAPMSPNESRARADSTPFYRSADGRWFAFYPTHPEKDWPIIFAAAGLSALAQDPRFQGPAGRAANARAMKAALDRGFGACTIGEIGRVLTSGGVTWSVLADLSEVVTDPDAAAADAFIAVDDGAGGELRTPGFPVRFPGVDLGVAGEVPTIGQHTDEILRELGRDPATIARLRATQVVG